MKGYFTVETSLILPMVLAVQVFLIYAMLRQYDRCLLEQDMGILTVYAGAAGNTQEADRALERKNNQRQQQPYLIYEEEELSLNADGGYIEAHSRGKVRMPDMGWQQVLSGENFLSLEAGYGHAGRLLKVENLQIQKGKVVKMLQTEFTRGLNCNYLRLLLEKEPEEKRYQYCILTRGGIRGLLPCSLRYINGDAYLYYDISSTQNVAQLYGGRKINRECGV